MYVLVPHSFRCIIACVYHSHELHIGGGGKHIHGSGEVLQNYVISSSIWLSVDHTSIILLNRTQYHRLFLGYGTLQKAIVLLFYYFMFYVTKSRNVTQDRFSQRTPYPPQVTAETKHEWNQTRLDRILVDYLLREVCIYLVFGIGVELKQPSHIHNIRDCTHTRGFLAGLLRVSYSDCSGLQYRGVHCA